MKKSKMLLVSAMLSVVLVVSLLGGCSSSTKTTDEPKTTNGGETTSSEVSLKILFPGDPPKDLDAVNSAIEKKLKADGLNIKLNYTWVPWDTYWNKQSLVVAAGESYDLTWSHVSMLPQSAAKNVLMPIDDVLKSSGPELLENTPDYVWKAAQVGGKTYAIPRVVPTAQSNDTFQIHGNLRKKYGLPEIKSADDFEKFLQAVKTNDPSITPLFGTDGLVREFAPSYYTNGDFAQSFFYVDVNDKPLTFKNMFESDAYEKVVNKSRDWYKKGYLVQDPLAVKDQGGDFTRGKIAAMVSNILRPTEYIDTLKRNLPGAELEFVQFAPDQPKYIFNSADNLLAVMSNSTHAKEAIQFVNWVHSSQENYDLFSLGVKDVNYKVDGNSASYEGIPADKQYLPISWAWTDMRFHKFSKHLTPQQLETIKNWDKGAIQTPLIGFSIDTEPVKTEVAKITTILKEYNPQLLAGMVDFSSVKDKYLSRLKDAGIDKVLAEYQKQLDTYLASNK